MLTQYSEQTNIGKFYQKNNVFEVDSEIKVGIFVLSGKSYCNEKHFALLVTVFFFCFSKNVCAKENGWIPISVLLKIQNTQASLCKAKFTENRFFNPLSCLVFTRSVHNKAFDWHLVRLLTFFFLPEITAFFSQKQIIIFATKKIFRLKKCAVIFRYTMCVHSNWNRNRLMEIKNSHFSIHIISLIANKMLINAKYWHISNIQIVIFVFRIKYRWFYFEKCVKNDFENSFLFFLWSIINNSISCLPIWIGNISHETSIRFFREATHMHFCVRFI